jgi:hypothetical protein
MANTYGILSTGGKNDRTMLGRNDHGITANLSTWQGSVIVALDDDGTFVIRVGEKDGSASAIIARGNVGDLDRHFIAGDGKVRYIDDDGKITEAEPITIHFANPEVLG